MVADWDAPASKYLIVEKRINPIGPDSVYSEYIYAKNMEPMYMYIYLCHTWNKFLRRQPVARMLTFFQVRYMYIYSLTVVR